LIERRRNRVTPKTIFEEIEEEGNEIAEGIEEYWSD
jgi:hypothetical protein